MRKSVPLSSLNHTATAVEAELYMQTNQLQETTNLIDDWEMGDDELLDIVDDSQVVGDEVDSPENVLDTCPICGATFVDFCLSVSATLYSGSWSMFMPPDSATTSTREYMY